MKERPKVVNVRSAERGTYVYVGRGNLRWGLVRSVFHNPFTRGSRDKMCDDFEVMIQHDPHLRDRVRRELCGKDLGCWCAPARCHADTLLEIANAPLDDAA